MSYLMSKGLMTHMAPPPPGGDQDVGTFWGALITDGRWDDYTAFKAIVME